MYLSGATETPHPAATLVHGNYRWQMRGNLTTIRAHLCVSFPAEARMVGRREATGPGLATQRLAARPASPPRPQGIHPTSQVLSSHGFALTFAPPTHSMGGPPDTALGRDTPARMTSDGQLALRRS
jgi:hypothetical protein